MERSPFPAAVVFPAFSLGTPRQAATFTDGQWNGDGLRRRSVAPGHALGLVRLLRPDTPRTADETEARFIIRDHNGQGAPAGPFFRPFPRRWLLGRCRKHECSQVAGRVQLVGDLPCQQ